MALTPFYKVIIQKTGRDISGIISRLSHELAVDEDNLIVLEIKNTKPDIVDDPDLKEGEILSFNYGYLSGKVGPIYLCRISSIIPDYGDIINITIRCTDLGLLMKKNSSKKVWTNISSSDIVKQIALANGLKAVVDKTSRVHVTMPQATKSDYDFIKYLVSLEQDGSWRFFMRSDEIHFTRLKLEAQSSRTVVYNDANKGVKRFKPYSEEILKSAASRDTIVTSTDPFTNKAVNNVINNSTSKDDVKLGDFTYDLNSVQLGYGKNPLTGGKSSPLQGQRPSQVQKATQDPSKTGQHVYTPSRLSDEALAIGNKVKKKKALSDYMANLTIEGDPDFIEDTVITMSGTIAKKDSGNWYVSRASHIIESTLGYETRGVLNKNAGKKPIGNKDIQKNVNSTVGTDKTQNSQVKKDVKLIYYDKDANEIKSP